MIEKYKDILNYELIEYYYCIFNILSRQNAPLKTKKTYADYLLANIGTEFIYTDPETVEKLLDVHSFLLSTI